MLANKHLAPVLAEVTAAFEVQCGELFNVDKRCAAEFYEVYRGVVAASEYSGMVDELTSGPCLVLEIRRPCAAATSTLTCADRSSHVCSLLPLAAEPYTCRRKL